MKANPFVLPMILMCVLAVCVSFAIDIPTHSLWGLLAWGPWLVTLVGCWCCIIRDGKP